MNISEHELDYIHAKYVKNNMHVSCDEYHAHGFECLIFDNDDAKIILRLIESYRHTARLKSKISNLLED